MTGNFVVRECHKLISLKGIAQTVNGYLIVANCKKLTFIKELSGTTISGGVTIRNCAMTTLEGSPRAVNGEFDVYNNKLESLVGGPETVTGDYCCEENQLVTLEGAPSTCAAFNAQRNQLESLKHAPRCTILNVAYNKITSLKGVHKDLGTHKFDTVNITYNPIEKAVLGLILINADSAYFQSPFEVIAIINKHAGRGKAGVIAAQQEILDLDDGKYEAFAEL